MNGSDHRKIVELAIPALPTPTRAFWQPLSPAITETCMQPDAVAIALLNGEDGPWRHYFPETVPMRGAVTPDAVGHAIPLRLRLDGRVQNVGGLCVVPHALPIKDTQYLAAVESDLPPGSFNRFECAAGLLAGVTPQPACRFAVEADGQTLVESADVREQDNALHLDADVSACRRLRLVVHTDGSTDKLAFTVWGTPTVRALQPQERRQDP